MSINTKDSPLYLDIEDILKFDSSKGDYDSHFEMEVKVHTPEKNLDHSDGVTLVGLLKYRDYLNHMTDYIEVQISVLLGTFVYDIYPYLNNVEVTIYHVKQFKPNGLPVTIRERYKGVYLLERNSYTPSVTNSSREMMNQELPIVLTLQLLDRSAEAVRIKTVQGSFDRKVNPGNRDMKIGSFMKSIMSSQLDSLTLEGSPVVDKLSIEPVDNTEELESITIPTGTRLVELTEYLQKVSIGVYKGGIGNYLQRVYNVRDGASKCMFIYSTYNSSKYHRDRNKIIFYSPPTSSYSMTDKTWSEEANILRVLVDTTTSLSDTKESSVMSTGIGFRTSNAKSIMNKPTIITEEGPVFNRATTNTEVIHKSREDGTNYAPYKGISSNHFRNTTEVLAKSGKYAKLTGNNMDPDYFYPGSSCKVVFEDKGKIVELYGVLHKVRVQYVMSSPNLISMYKDPVVKFNTNLEFEIFITG